MANDEIRRLRAEVRKRRADATAKIGRIRRTKGVDIAGTSFDPRRNVKAINSYNSTQLKAYLRSLNNFQSRSVGYVAGAGGVPLPKAQWERYKSLERRFNKVGDANFRAVADTAIPGKGMTIRERNDTIVPTRKSAAGDAANTPYGRVNRKASDISSIAALDKLARSFQKKIDPKYLPQAIRKARKQANSMLDDLGYSGFKSRIRKLSQHQMDILWNHTDFATRLSMNYESWKKRMGGNVERYQDQLEEDAAFDIDELIEWAENQPKQAPKS